MRTVSEPEPCCVAAEAEARQNPLADGAFVVREYVRREDVDEKRDVLHGADCIKIKVSALVLQSEML